MDEIKERAFLALISELDKDIEALNNKNDLEFEAKYVIFDELLKHVGAKKTYSFVCSKEALKEIKKYMEEAIEDSDLGIGNDK